MDVQRQLRVNLCQCDFAIQQGMAEHIAEVVARREACETLDQVAERTGRHRRAWRRVAALPPMAAQEPRGLPRLYRGQWEGNKATCRDGVLRIERPKSDEARAKRISVKTA